MRGTFILDTAQDHGNSLFILELMHVHQCNIACSVVHVQVCYNRFYLLLYSLLLHVALKSVVLIEYMQ